MRSVKEGWPGRGCWEEDVNWMESENSLALGAAFLEVVPSNTSHTEWHNRCYIKYASGEVLGEMM